MFAWLSGICSVYGAEDVKKWNDIANQEYKFMANGSLADQLAKAGTMFDGHVTNGSLAQILRVVQHHVMEATTRMDLAMVDSSHTWVNTGPMGLGYGMEIKDDIKDGETVCRHGANPFECQECGRNHIGSQP